MTLRKPFETNYPRWRHVAHQYVVKIEGVQNYSGEHGIYSTVTVIGTRQDPKAKKTWSAETFRKNFEPIGRKKKAKSALERLIDEEK